MIDQYFEDYEVKDDFHKEFITLWDGWLGRDKFHLLDEVTEKEWLRFHELVKDLFEEFELYKVNLEMGACDKVNSLSEVEESYNESMNKGSGDFFKFIIPELNVVLTEEYDFTWILWYKDISALKVVSSKIL